MSATKCSPKMITVHKVDSSETVNPINDINKNLQMVSARATLDSCNDTQVQEEPPKMPEPLPDPNVRYAGLMEGYQAPYMYNNIDQTVQFLIIVFFGAGAYALFKGLK
jgi:hypothetical protein